MRHFHFLNKITKNSLTIWTFFKDLFGDKIFVKHIPKIALNIQHPIGDFPVPNWYISIILTFLEFFNKI